MGIEDMGGHMPVPRNPLPTLDTLIETQRRNPEDLGNRDLLLDPRAVLQTAFKVAQDRGLAVPAHAYDERHRELLPIRIVERMDTREFLLRQPVGACAPLLRLGSIRHRASPRRLSREVGMASNQRGALLGRRCTYGRHHGRMQGRDRSERALMERGQRDPWRMLIDVAKSSNKGLLVRRVQGCKRNWGHQRRDRSHTLLSNYMRLRGERAMLAVPVAGAGRPARGTQNHAVGAR